MEMEETATVRGDNENSTDEKRTEWNERPTDRTKGERRKVLELVLVCVVPGQDRNYGGYRRSGFDLKEPPLFTFPADKTLNR